MKYSSPKFLLFGLVFICLSLTGICRPRLATEEELIFYPGRLTKTEVEVFSKLNLEREWPGKGLLRFLNQHKGKNKKLIAALLAFPFPFGIIGLHRIYLGTAPHVPVVYIGTLGGVFGILPLIDFIAILASPDVSTYLDNRKVFMWVR